jgi:trk system potassium uptake protein TrkH
MVFMIAGGVSFGVHYQAMRGLDIRVYWKHAETRVFLLILAGMAFLATLYLLSQHRQAPAGETVMNAVFQVIGVMTTSGFRTESFSDWPGFLPVLLIFVSIMGACAGSASGGMKTARFMLVYKQGVREVALLIHPNAVSPVKLGKRVMPNSLMEAVWGFFAAYTLTYVLLLLLFMATGLDQISAFSAVAATLNNLGPGLGEVAQNFATVTDAAKLIGVVAMLLGRLEIFVLLVLLKPDFWRH